MGYYTNWEKYFFGIYEDYPIEIQKKMKNLLFFNTVGLIIWSAIVIMRLFLVGSLSFFIILGDFIALLIFPISLYLMRKNEPVFAGNVTMGLVSVIVIQLIFGDFFSEYFRPINRLYETTAILIVGLLIITLYALKRVQYAMYTFIMVGILSLHFFVLVFHSYEGIFYNETIYTFAESVFFLIIAGIASFTILSLTVQSRTNVFTNVVLYKMTKMGPNAFFTEHPLEEDLLMTSGVYIYTAIGQGHSYPTGLFGPLPFGDDKNQVALVYSTIVTDSNFPDPRLDGKNYIMIAFISKRGDEDLIDRRKLSEIISTQIKEISDLSTLQEKEIFQIIHVIRSQ